jgi:signal transduction histidine kinase
VGRVTTGRGPVELHVDSDLDLPAGLELAVYRIVQEALTNAVKHAPGSEVDISVRRGGDDLLVTVRNTAATARLDSPPTGAGRGLVGIRERVALYDGTVDAGPTPDGGYSLTAVIPSLRHADVHVSSASATP